MAKNYYCSLTGNLNLKGGHFMDWTVFYLGAIVQLYYLHKNNSVFFYISLEKPSVFVYSTMFYIMSCILFQQKLPFKLVLNYPPRLNIGNYLQFRLKIVITNWYQRRLAPHKMAYYWLETSSRYNSKYIFTQLRSQLALGRKEVTLRAFHPNHHRGAQPLCQ